MPAAATARRRSALEVNGHLVAPALAGPNAWNMQSRNYFYFVSTILPGFICRNMPPGQENTLSNQECRDIAYYISNLPRPAGDRQGPLVAAAAAGADDRHAAADAADGIRQDATAAPASTTTERDQ